jgi:hypothetical protein
VHLLVYSGGLIHENARCNSESMPDVFKNNSARIIETKQFLLLRVEQCVTATHIHHKNNTFTRYIDSGGKKKKKSIHI